MTELPTNALVELRNGFDHLYPQSFPGSRGWVRDRKPDDLGYPHVLIEWDKDHWRYNGEPDGWAFETHFQLVEPPKAERVEHPEQFLRSMIREAQEQIDSEVCPDCGEDHVETERSMERYADAFAKGAEAMQEGAGFFLITVQGRSDPERPDVGVWIPEIFSAALAPEAKALIEAQVLQLASNHMREEAQRKINGGDQ